MGLNVAWTVTFESLTSNSEVDTVNGELVRTEGWLLYCQFKSDEHALDKAVLFHICLVPPEIKTLREGSTLWVKGKIKQVRRVSGWGVFLERDPEVLVLKRK